jgi:hypothetical protein
MLKVSSEWVKYKASPVSSQPFWISQEQVTWPWCNLAASQRRPYCASMNSYSPVGLVSRQWGTTDWACVLCDHRIHNDWACRSANLHQCGCPFYSFVQGFCGKTLHHPGLSVTLQPRFGSLWLLVFPQGQITIESEDICECNGHTVHKLSYWRLTANWLAPQESDCSRMCCKVSSDCLPSYIMATPPVLKIFKTNGYFPDRPRT